MTLQHRSILKPRVGGAIAEKEVDELSSRTTFVGARVVVACRTNNGRSGSKVSYGCCAAMDRVQAIFLANLGNSEQQTGE